jgi:glycolate oxidase FAD binding subunit
LQLPGAQLMEWGGAQRWWITDTDAQTVRISAKQAGGHATIFRAGSAFDRSVGVFTPLPTPIMKIHRGLKTAFDPARVQSRPAISGFLMQQAFPSRRSAQPSPTQRPSKR